ncbi:hypothetical protein SBRCBS47491_005887 [Sporothrix bragantina]|uniref:Cyclase n=1 Tax=Sporothrix bragantina TaxID=671064 RepID=A0ABP0C0B6_9PEZI
MSLNVPDFDDLPPVEGMPQGWAWGIFDKDGQKDVYGTLNFLTKDVVKAAGKEVQEGISVSLNWPIDAVKKPTSGRTALEHKVLPFTIHDHGFIGLDDEVRFNTQSSSQWDSLCHFPHQPTGAGYNGTLAVVGSVKGPKAVNTAPTLEHWHERGCLVARGVLLDYRAYAERHNISYTSLDKHVISIADLEACALEQNTELRPGDVLLVRCGFTEEMSQLSPDEQTKVLYGYRFCGVESSVEMAKWLWNHRFSAVAGDSISFEVSPPQLKQADGSVKEGTGAEYVLHPYLLSGFGMSIGELWDLKKLAATCAELKRYSFMLTSVPLNYKGSIGSPPNAVAIF